MLPAWLLPCSSIALKRLYLPCNDVHSLITIQRLQIQPITNQALGIYTIFSLLVALFIFSCTYSLNLSHYNVSSICPQLPLRRPTLRHTPSFYSDGNATFLGLHRQQLVTYFACVVSVTNIFPALREFKTYGEHSGNKPIFVLRLFMRSECKFAVSGSANIAK
jgi:hypothetical protein